jgi:sortase (surface protein transpeptidase)
VIRQLLGGLLGVVVIALFIGLPFIVRSAFSAPVSQVAEVPTAAETSTVAPTTAPSDVAGPVVTEQPSTEPQAKPQRLARPVRVQIPSIGVDADLRAIGLLEDGSMEVPDFGLAGWYNLGPRPGEAGPAVIVAHVDSYQGPDVFFRLRELSSGDVVKVRHKDGTTSRFVVRSSEQQLKEKLPVDRIWNKTSEPVLRLVTCGGDFDETERHYRSNVIVYADSKAS